MNEMQMRAVAALQVMGFADASLSSRIKSSMREQWLRLDKKIMENEVAKLNDALYGMLAEYDKGEDSLDFMRCVDKACEDGRALELAQRYSELLYAALTGSISPLTSCSTIVNRLTKRRYDIIDSVQAPFFINDALWVMHAFDVTHLTDARHDSINYINACRNFPDPIYGSEPEYKSFADGKVAISKKITGVGGKDSYLLITPSGMVEAVQAANPFIGNGASCDLHTCEQRIFSRIPSIVDFLLSAGFRGPYYGKFALLRVDGLPLKTPSRNPMFDEPRSSPCILDQVETLTFKFSTSGDFDIAAKGPLDELWRAFEVERSLSYDRNGRRR